MAKGKGNNSGNNQPQKHRKISGGSKVQRYARKEIRMATKKLRRMGHLSTDIRTLDGQALRLRAHLTRMEAMASLPAKYPSF